MKNIESIDPLCGEDHEDEEFLYKNDKEHNFVPIDQVADLEVKHGFDSFEDEEQDPGNEIEESSSTDQEKIKELQQEIKFAQYAGAASVGPDVEAHTTEKKPIVVDEENKEFEKYDTLPSHKSVTRNHAVSGTPASRIKIQHGVRSMARYDNLKTMNASKTERTFGQKVKDFIFKQNIVWDRNRDELVRDSQDEEARKYKKKFPEYFK